MTTYFRSHLGAKLLLSYLAIIVVGVLVLLVSSQAILPATFNHHISGMGMMMRNGMMGGASSDEMSQLYLDYRASFNEALRYAAFAAMVVAVLLSLYLSRSVIAPVRGMSLAAQRVAEGHYEERVQAPGEDELS